MAGDVIRTLLSASPPAAPPAAGAAKKRKGWKEEGEEEEEGNTEEEGGYKRPHAKGSLAKGRAERKAEARERSIASRLLRPLGL
jgi:hypothetical protein